MFLLAISSFWFGCNNAAKELVKERTIYTRERDFNLLVSSYFSSKILLLTLFSAIQTVALFAIVRSWCTPPGAALPQLAVLLALALAGVSIGLAISALAASEEMAITLIPMVVIPQIILSGAIVPLDGVSKWLGQFAVATYWGKRGLDAGLPANLVRAIGLDQHSTAFALLVLLAHACVAIGLALAVLHWQNRRR
jgi:ABC-type multidrug transport system permease subunit